jgi:hypothetical protein
MHIGLWSLCDSYYSVFRCDTVSESVVNGSIPLRFNFSEYQSSSLGSCGLSASLSLLVYKCVVVLLLSLSAQVSAMFFSSRVRELHLELKLFQSSRKDTGDPVVSSPLLFYSSLPEFGWHSVHHLLWQVRFSCRSTDS